MNKKQARKTILEYVISGLRAQTTCDDLKENSTDADYDRLCDAEEHWANVFQRLIDTNAFGDAKPPVSD